MAIDKAINQAPRGIGSNLDMFGGDLNDEPAVTVDIAPDEGDMADEAIPTLDPQELFYMNLATSIDEQELTKIGSDVIEFFEADLKSREDWETTYEQGLDLLGLRYEERTEPWEGACGVTHPLLAEAVVRFQSEAVIETFPAAGPCKTEILGEETDENVESAYRVQADMNNWLTNKMKEYRPEHERMLWNLAIAGSAFKKVYFDPAMQRPTSVFVSAADFVVSFGSTDLHTAERYTHRMRKTENDIAKLQYAKFYRDIDIEKTAKTSTAGGKGKKKEDKLSGANDDNDDRPELCEMHVDLEIKGYEDVDAKGEETGILLPYVVTFVRNTGDILSIYRNWRHDDPTKSRRRHFVHYPYVPGFGFYAYGLIHLVGGFAKSATSILRQLTDAGTLSNLPGGLKTKGIRFVRDSDPIMPGEFRDVDVPSGTLKDNIVPLPYKEPSATLYQLFNTIVDEGRRFANVADVNMQDMNADAPVGTTLALLERTLKVSTAIQARMHAAMKDELGLLKDIIQENTSDTYDYNVKGGAQVKKADYDAVDIIPVSDPNASTMSQRVVQYQAVMQMAQSAPQIYDMSELHHQMHEVLGIKNSEKLLPGLGKNTPQDPVTENMAILMMKPVKAYIHQDHQAHLAVHQAAMQDPKIMQTVGQNPQAPIIQQAMMAHLMEHTAFAYRQQIETAMGIPLNAPDEALPPEVEQQLSAKLAQAANQTLQQNQQAAAQQQAAQAAQDPVLQAQQKDQDLKQQELDLKKVAHADDLKFKYADLKTRTVLQAGQAEGQQKVQAANAKEQATTQRLQTLVNAATQQEQMAHQKETQAKQHGHEHVQGVLTRRQQKAKEKADVNNSPTGTDNQPTGDQVS